MSTEPRTQTDTVDRTIRNQRYRGWPVLLVLGIWCVFWMGAAYALERWAFPPPQPGFPWIWLFWGVPVIASFIAMTIHINRRPPKRIKLGDGVWIVPGPRVPPKDIHAFHFARDPDEDYVEKNLPIPWCELMIEFRKRRVRLIVSFGDAARVREWAEQMSIRIIDAEGYSRRINAKEVRE